MFSSSSSQWRQGCTWTRQRMVLPMSELPLLKQHTGLAVSWATVCVLVGRDSSSWTWSGSRTWSSALVRRAAGQPRHLRQVLHDPLSAPIFRGTCLCRHLWPSGHHHLFLHGVILPLMPSGRLFVKTTAEIGECGGLIYLRPRLSDFRVPGICGKVTLVKTQGGLSTSDIDFYWDCLFPIGASYQEGSMHV